MKNIHELGQLFEFVQMQNVFPDNKTFPDCTPKYNLSLINEKFLNEKDLPNFELKDFISENFDLPESYSFSYKTDTNESIEEHIEKLWTVLTRQPKAEHTSLIPLPNAYVVPGGRFREVYYWDSFFTMLGLQVSGRIDLIQQMVDNFSYLINQIGLIPNGNRTYYTSRSQPPYYSLMVRLLSEEKGSQILVDYLPYLEKEYQFWMSGKYALTDVNNAIGRVVKMPDNSILNRFWDEKDAPRPEAFKEDVELSHKSTQSPPQLFRNLRAAAESGWDFSSRWFKDENSFESIHTTDIIPVDLNCLLVHLEETLSEAYLLNNDTENTLKFKYYAQKRQEAIQKYCWDKTKMFYFDFDFIENKPKIHYTLAATYPLYFGISTEKQAEKVAIVIEEKFLKKGGLITTLKATEQQWDAPNGWAPLQWIAYKGLLNYDITSLAQKIKTNWMKLNLTVYKNSGKLTEKYNVDSEIGEASGGEYPNQDGFGWTNGVYLKMLVSKP
ncbi:alpha,alpha-trehalase TreF [Emticicia sp. SJ17W-69]|uniref:alpha,alpha-trehalase TreF n=1 Tax=Emticicia sp. SJ17W-69 TaxID=3421657 RepID=UPI003EBDD206